MSAPRALLTSVSLTLVTCFILTPHAFANESALANSPEGSAAPPSTIQQLVPKRRQLKLAGGGAQATALIGLIQSTVSPDSWDPASTAAVAGGNSSPSAIQLVDIIQTSIQPYSWAINGGTGTIMLVPW